MIPHLSRRNPPVIKVIKRTDRIKVLFILHLLMLREELLKLMSNSFEWNRMGFFCGNFF